LCIQRIAIAFEFGTTGGSERSMLAVVDRLPDAPFEFVALAPVAGRLADALKRRGISHVPLELRDASGARLPRRRACRNLAGAIRRCSPSLVHANSLSMGRLTGAIAAELSLPTIAHLRDILKLSRAAVGDLNRNRLLLAVSQATKRFHVEQGLHAERTRVLYNGVDPSRFRPRRQTGDLRRELGVADDRFLVATIGQIGLRKGQDVLAEAAATLSRRLPRVDYLFVGERYSAKAESIAFERNVIARFQEAGMGERLHLLGYRDDVARLMNEVDLLVHPAHQEPLGRVLLEAAAAGLPIVATSVGGTEEILVDDESARLIPAGNSQALARAIAELHDDARLRAEMAAAARKRVLARFDVDRAAREQAAVWCGMVE